MKQANMIWNVLIMILMLMAFAMILYIGSVNLSAFSDAVNEKQLIEELGRVSTALDSCNDKLSRRSRTEVSILTSDIEAVCILGQSGEIFTESAQETFKLLTTTGDNVILMNKVQYDGEQISAFQVLRSDSIEVSGTRKTECFVRNEGKLDVQVRC